MASEHVLMDMLHLATDDRAVHSLRGEQAAKAARALPGRGHHARSSWSAPPPSIARWLRWSSTSPTSLTRRGGTPAPRGASVSTTSRFGPGPARDEPNSRSGRMQGRLCGRPGPDELAHGDEWGRGWRPITTHPGAGRKTRATSRWRRSALVAPSPVNPLRWMWTSRTRRVSSCPEPTCPGRNSPSGRYPSKLMSSSAVAVSWWSTVADGPQASTNSRCVGTAPDALPLTRRAWRWSGCHQEPLTVV